MAVTACEYNTSCQRKYTECKLATLVRSPYRPTLLLYQALLSGPVVNQASLDQMLARSLGSRYGLGLHFIETSHSFGIGHRRCHFVIRNDVRHIPDVGATLVLLVNGGEGGVTGKLCNRLWDDVVQATLDGL